MVKLSLPSWDRDKSQLQAGTSFAPTLAGRFKSSASSTTPTVLRRLKLSDNATTQPTHHPLMTLRLSSPSFLDSVVHDGSSDNPLYVIDTDDNVTKVRRSDPKGFVKVCAIRWPMDPIKPMSRKNKDLIGVEVAFGKGAWKSADDFLGYSYSSLSSYRKFYVPHHPHSLKWKPSGPHYACTTETVKGPVAILEPATLRSPPQVKILDPLFRVGTSRPQRMHNGLALSLLDFLLVTAMLLLTPNDEWMNVTRTCQSDFVPDSDPPYDSSFSHEPSDMKPQLLTPEATPAIERWRSAIPPRVVEDNRSECGESSDGESSSSRPTSRLSFHMDTQSTAQHSEYPPRQGLFALSDSSLSLASHAFSFPRRGHGRTRELPLPPTLPPTPVSHGPSFARGPPPSASSYASLVSHRPHGQHAQDEPPPIPPLPSSSSTSSRPRVVRPVINTSSVFSRPVPGSPTSSIHSRSLPVPPTPSTSKPRMPLLPLIDSSPPTTPISALPEPVTPLPRRSSLLRTHSYSHLRNASTPYSDSPHDLKPLVKAPPNYVASTPDPPPLPVSAHASVQHGAMNRSLSIRTRDVAPVLSAASASTSAETSFADADPYDMPPAYSLIDLAHSSSQLQIVNGEMGGQ